MTFDSEPASQGFTVVDVDRVRDADKCGCPDGVSDIRGYWE